MSVCLRAALSFVVVQVLAGCADRTIDFRIGSDSAPSAATYTVHVFRASCADITLNSVLLSSATSPGVAHMEVSTEGLSAHVSGLEADPYAVTALLRNRDCMPLAFGCVDVSPTADHVLEMSLSTLDIAPSIVCPVEDGQLLTCDGQGKCVSGSALGCVNMFGENVRICSEECVDLDVDPRHCGECGRECPDAPCIGGECERRVACDESQCARCCGDDCVDPYQNPSHCGECYHPCLPPTACVGGRCVPDDPATSSLTAEIPDNGTPPGPWYALADWVDEEAQCPGSTVSAELLAQPSTDGAEMLFQLPAQAPPPGTSRVQVGALSVVPDFDRSQSLSADELQEAVPIACVLVASESDFPRNDPLVQAFEGMGLSFPEGLARGTSFYIWTHELAGFVPAHESQVAGVAPPLQHPCGPFL